MSKRKSLEACSSGPAGGYLEVGRTEDTHEVVINHPDLKPDANGVGHIVFSPREAKELANLLMKHALYAEAEANGIDVKLVCVDR